MMAVLAWFQRCQIQGLVQWWYTLYMFYEGDQFYEATQRTVPGCGASISDYSSLLQTIFFSA